MLAVAKTSEQQAIIGLCGFAGLRIQEALDANTSWFDMTTRQLRVRGKGDKERFVPISDRCWEAVSYAFIDAMVSPDGRLVTYQERSARKAVTMMGRKAKLARSVASHDLRATFATIVYNKTRDQRLVQELLGHASGTTTEVYIGVAQNALTEAVAF